MGGEGKNPPFDRFFHLVAESFKKEGAQGRGDDVQQPIWWHHHGYKLIVQKCDIPNRCVEFATNAVSIRFTERATTVDEGWFVDWVIRYSQQEEVRGRVILSTGDLLVAFALEEAKEEGVDTAFARRFDADVAHRGRYIRTGPFLSIPGPGTGHDGDPNMSIYLEDSIRIAMSKLLKK